MELYFTEEWYLYIDGKLHRTLFSLSGDSILRRDEHGIPSVSGQYEMSLCGRINLFVAGSVTDDYYADERCCEECEKLSLLAELGR